MDIDEKVDNLLCSKGMTTVQKQQFWNHVLAVGDFLIAFLLVSMVFVPFFDKHISFSVGADDIRDDGTNETVNATIPEPATEGFEISGINFENLNVTWHDTGDTGWTNGNDVDCVRLNNTYIDVNLSSYQLFVPDSLTNASFLQYRLEEWWEGDAARIQYNLQYDRYFEYDYSDDDLSALLGYDHAANSIYPANYFQTGSRETFAHYDADKMRAFNVDKLVDTESTYNVSWKIDVSAEYGALRIDYELWFSNATTNDLVYTFTDFYGVNAPPLSDKIRIKNSDETFNSLNATIDKNSSMVQLVKWHGESVMNISLDNGLPTGWAVENTTFTQQYTDSKVHFYPVNITSDSGLEFLLELNSNPSSNIVSFDVEAPNLDFFYQSPLHPDHPTWVNNNNPDDTNESNATSWRPENVVGSYAVYHNNKRDNQYKTGKLFHIYRPMIIDANDDWIWGSLSVENGKMNITIPQSFLDTATYPIRVDPTFGCEGTSGSFFGVNSQYSTNLFTITEDGDGENMLVYGKGSRVNQDWVYSGSLYLYNSEDDQYDRIANGKTEEPTVTESFSATWLNLSFPTSPSLDQNTEYMFAAGGDGNNRYGQFLQIGCDDTTDKIATRGIYDSDPFTHMVTYYNLTFSYYVIYTLTGGGNNAPTITGEVPSNTSTGISLQPSVNVTVNDADGDTMNVTFASNYSGSWTNYQTNSSASNGSYQWDFTGANTESTKYYWRVYADDGTDNVSETYYFTTGSTPTWQTISNTIGDGILSNSTSWQTISNNIGDGTLSNTTSWQTISDTIGDGIIGNTTSWKTISDTIGDGSLSHTSTWQTISSTIGDGSLGNTTSWQTISSTIGDGTLAHVSTWQTISNTIGDGTLSNSTSWQTISDTIGDGTIGNTTSWKTISDTIGDGTLAHASTWQTISNTIGDGTLGNATNWQTISDSIGDGTLGNITSWQSISNNIGDGALGNTTSWKTISDNIGDGTLANTTIETWQTISNTIGDGTLGNTTTWNTISSTIGDGSLGNTTSWQTISNTIGDGSLSHISTWQTISSTIGDGTLSNTATWQTISNTIGDGTLGNTTSWKTISDTIGNGTLRNTSGPWHTISDTIGNGTLGNTTSGTTDDTDDSGGGSGSITIPNEPEIKIIVNESTPKTVSGNLNISEEQKTNKYFAYWYLTLSNNKTNLSVLSGKNFVEQFLNETFVFTFDTELPEGTYYLNAEVYDHPKEFGNNIGKETEEVTVKDPFFLKPQLWMIFLVIGGVLIWFILKNDKITVFKRIKK